MNRIVTTALVLSTVLSWTLNAAEPAAQKKRFDPREAGLLVVPNSQKGVIAFVNGQSRMPAGDIEAIAAVVRQATSCDVRVGNSAEGATVVIEVVDSDADYTMAAYPEDFKATLNVRKVAAGRCRKELLRAFCFACGVGGSRYPENILALETFADIDRVKEFIPVDAVQLIQRRLANGGVTPLRLVPYGKACHEGWAPAPTNEVQKFIWDKVHALPKNPIKIEFDPKKGR